MENPNLPPFACTPSTLQRVQVATAGEALVDMLQQPDGLFLPALGGSVFNLTLALARQGIVSAYLNPLSKDWFGQQFSATLNSNGVVLPNSEAVLQPSALALVQTDARGHPSYSFYREGVADRAITAEQLQSACATMPNLSLACTGCLALAPADASVYLIWLQAQKAAGVVVAVDANLRADVMSDLAAYRSNVFRALGMADIVKISDEDLYHLGYTTTDPMDSAQDLLKTLSARVLLLTLGAKGAWALVRSEDTIKTFFAKEQKALSIADTVGAGDCFFAGFLAAWLEQAQDIESALKRAIASASLNVQKTGCVPATRAEILEWLG